MQLNKQKDRPPKVFTHEGALAARLNAELQLRRSVMACLLWEDTFYEDGVDIAERILDLITKVKPERVAEIAIEAREKQKLRHIPLLLVRQMAKLDTHKGLVADTLSRVIQRPDEIAEYLAIYWKDGKQPISAQSKKGLARAFRKFSEYSLAKYNKDGAIKLRDVMFLSHPKPGPDSGNEIRLIERQYEKDGPKNILARHEGSIFGKLADGTLQTPDTWEVALSAGENKAQAFVRLMAEDKLGALAFLRNLRNMEQAGVCENLVRAYSKVVDLKRVLPFRFISAARAVPLWEPMIEEMMLRALQEQPKLTGKTVIVVDNSGSMYGAKVSAKSEIDRADAAAALAILIREIAEQPVVIAYSNDAVIVPARRGFGLKEALERATSHGGTDTNKAIVLANRADYDRIIVITDEQSHTRVSNPISDKAYFINVSVEQNGIGYGMWTHIDGWSEAILDYIRAAEGAAVDAVVNED